ncbi:MAG: DNA topoisomerase 4 subunit A [Lachnospiraceae bacterium]|nr:DNA topoisomerase 4 subunit A [Lachnospiraceae bacterium]
MTETENLVQLDYSEEMKTSYRDYALSVIIARALPDVRDGLKPVQRRILYAMNELGLDPKKPHRKSARIVGDTMGKYHPHGDSSIYDAMVHMTEDYSLCVPLVDGHGNFGSIDGDGAAAMRYTEARLSEGGMTLLENLDMDLVEFMPNFDNSEKEPTVLPAMTPNLLINGTSGIAVGMATNIPPHNPGEAIDAVMAYIDNPNITTECLMRYIPGPDFPTGGIITNTDALRELYETGEGKIRIRAKVETEKGESGRTNLVITEIPYTVAGNKTKLVESLVSMMKDKVFEEMYDVRDESSKEGIRIVIEVKKDRDAQNLLNGLYRKTAMEDTYSVNLLAVKGNQPKTFSLKELIKEFVDFQVELYTKEHEFLLAKAENRLEIVEGLVRATDVIDLIIEILRGSSTQKQARECLMRGDVTDIKFRSEESKRMAFKLDFTERQTDAILAMPLSRLVGLEILKLHEEMDKLNADIKNYRDILTDRQLLFKTIKTRLRSYKQKFAVKRRTELANLEVINYVEEFKEEELVILIDRFGYTKCVDMAAVQRAGEEGMAEFVYRIRMKNTDKLCVFTAEGNMFQVKASAIPRCKLKEKGTLIHNLCKVDREEIILYTSFEELFESQLLFVTKKGFVKLVSGIEFETARSVVQTTKLDADDALVNISMLGASDIIMGDRQVFLVTGKNLMLAYPVEEVVELKKTSRGVKGITLDKDDLVEAAGVYSPDDPEIEACGKKIPVKKIKTRKRGAKPQKI